MWGTDMTSIELSTGRKANVFAVIDHCTQECLGFWVSDDATRFSALEPLKMAVEYVHGGCSNNIAIGTKLRHDCGSAYLSKYFQDEVWFMGLESSPAFVREPQGNGVVERFFRTLKEQLLWLQRYETIDDLRTAVTQWIEDYNMCWMVAKHGYKSPAQVRAYFQMLKAA
jgi:transposase InsO family protein